MFFTEVLSVDHEILSAQSETMNLNIFGNPAHGVQVFKNVHDIANSPSSPASRTGLLLWYRVFIYYCVFSLKLCDFLNSASSAAALVFFLPGVCIHTDTKGKKGKSPEYFKIFENKHTIFNEHPVV